MEGSTPEQNKGISNLNISEGVVETFYNSPEWILSMILLVIERFIL